MRRRDLSATDSEGIGDPAQALDGGPGIRGTRMRRCVASGDTLDDAALIRFVVDPEGSLVPDLAAKLPGRGGWVRADRAHLALAVKRRAFSRAFKRDVRIPENLDNLVETLLLRRLLDGLGLARRVGALVTGFEAVSQNIRKGALCALIEARDAAADGRRKMVGLAAKAAPGTVLCALASAEELSDALGVPTVVHAGLAPGRSWPVLAVDMARLAGFRDPWPWEDAMPPGLAPPARHGTQTPRGA